MKNRSFFAGLIVGLICSFIFAAVSTMNAKGGSAGKYQIAITTVKAMNGYESIAEVIIDTENGVVQSRKQVDYFTQYKK